MFRAAEGRCAQSALKRGLGFRLWGLGGCVEGAG